MENDKKRLTEVEAELEKLYDAYAEACFNLTKERGYELYKPKYIAKAKEISDKYAKYIAPLEKEQMELMAKLEPEREKEEKAERLKLIKEAKEKAKKKSDVK